MIQVKESDFDVLTALSHDMANSRGGNDDRSSTSQAIPFQINDGKSDAPGASEAEIPHVPSSGSGSPPGEYSRFIPATPLEALSPQTGSGGSLPSPAVHNSSSDPKKALTPPLLPPQLLQVTFFSSFFFKVNKCIGQFKLRSTVIHNQNLSSGTLILRSLKLISPLPL